MNEVEFQLRKIECAECAKSKFSSLIEMNLITYFKIDGDLGLVQFQLEKGADLDEVLEKINSLGCRLLLINPLAFGASS